MKPTLALFGPEGEIARVDPGSEAEELWRSRGFAEEAEPKKAESAASLPLDPLGDALAKHRRGRKPKEATA